MAFDFFSDDLEKATFTDVEDFVQARVPEGIRIDYKGSKGARLRDDLGDPVTAFANTYGGLIFVGIDESGGIPTGIVGVPRARGDLKTRLVNHIASTTFPRLRPAITVIGVPGKVDHEIAVVRSLESDEKPHMYLPKSRISVRNGDRCEDADYSTLERLFAQRREAADRTGGRTDFDIYVAGISIDGKRVSRADDQIRLWIEALSPRDLLIDQAVEEAFVESVVAAGGITPALHGGVFVVKRGGLSVDFEWVDRDGAGYSTWRLTSERSLGMATHGASQKQRKTFLIDVVDKIAVTLRAAHAFYERLGRVGRFDVQLLVQFGPLPIVNTSSDGLRALTSVVGSGTATAEKMHAHRAVIDHATLPKAAALISAALLIALRAQRNVPVDYQKLEAEVRDILNG